MYRSVLCDIGLVALGAAVGGVARYLVINRLTPESWTTAATMLANITGCMLIGAVWAVLDHFGAHSAWKTLLVTGLLGGYTTYSAYALDIVTLCDDGHLVRAALYAVATAAGGVAACAAALWLTRRLLEHL